MKQATSKDKILKYKVTYPKAKPAAIAKALGLPITTVYTTLSAWRKRNKGITVLKRLDEVVAAPAKKRGRPSSQEKLTQFFVRAMQTSNTSVSDPVNHPAHYKVGGIETIDFIEAKKLNYNLGNVVKYITRADHKDLRKQDLEKAMWYLKREIDKA